MGRKKKVEISTEENGTTIISGTTEDIIDTLKTAAEKVEKHRKTIEVRSAALTGLLFCKYTYDHTVAPNTTNAVSVKSEVPVHEDLTSCFKKLEPHLAVICDEVLPEDIKDITFIPDSDPVSKKLHLFSVTEFKLDGYNEKEGIILIGDKELNIGGAVGLQTPKIKWDSNYAFVDELRIAIAECLFEVEEYMKGKQAENPQQEIPFALEEEHYAEEGL